MTTYKTTHDLTRDQLVELKQNYLCQLDESGELNEVLYGIDCDSPLTQGELANADLLVPDEVIHDHYAGIMFVEGDFY